MIPKTQKRGSTPKSHKNIKSISAKGTKKQLQYRQVSNLRPP